VSPEALFDSLVGSPSLSSFQSNNASLDCIFDDDSGTNFWPFKNADSFTPSSPQFMRFADIDYNSPSRRHLPIPLTNCSPPHLSTQEAVTIRYPLPTPRPNSRCHSRRTLVTLDQPAAQNTGLTLPPLVIPNETSPAISPTTSPIQDLIQARPSMIESLSIASRMSPWHGWNSWNPAV
jgi:hypothetical protein